MSEKELTIKDQLKSANELVEKLKNDLETVNKAVTLEYNIGVIFKKTGSKDYYTLICMPDSDIKLFNLKQQCYNGNPYPVEMCKKKDRSGNIKTITFHAMQIITGGESLDFEELEYK